MSKTWQHGHTPVPYAPCPFCGSRNVVALSDSQIGNHVRCEDCQGPTASYRRTAIMLWRVAPRNPDLPDTAEKDKSA